MALHIQEGWLETAKIVLSPNFDTRPTEGDLSLIVIHCISLPPGEFGDDWIDRLFTNALPKDAHPYFEGIAHLRVSAHVLISRDGAVTQYVPFEKRAWHAGASCYHGRTACNDYSIGIELEGTEFTEYTEAQYSCLIDVIESLLAHYPTLSRDAITGHSDIAPERKTDPGPSFRWELFYQMLAAKGV
jgi:AmpD protein